MEGGGGRGQDVQCRDLQGRATQGLEGGPIFSHMWACGPVGAGIGCQGVTGLTQDVVAGPHTPCFPFQIFLYTSSQTDVVTSWRAGLAPRLLGLGVRGRGHKADTRGHVVVAGVIGVPRNPRLAD